MDKLVGAMGPRRRAHRRDRTRRHGHHVCVEHVARPDVGGPGGPAFGKDNNDDPTGDDNNEERELRGQVIELHEDRTPPQALVATLGEDVWANLYNDQLHRSGIRQGDHVRMQGEYNKCVFDAYQVDVQDRCCPGTLSTATPATATTRASQQDVIQASSAMV